MFPYENIVIYKICVILWSGFGQNLMFSPDVVAPDGASCRSKRQKSDIRWGSGARQGNTARYVPSVIKRHIGITRFEAATTVLPRERFDEHSGAHEQLNVSNNK